MKDLTPRTAGGGLTRRGVLGAAAAIPVAVGLGTALGATLGAVPAAASVPSIWLYTGVWEPGAGAQHWHNRLTYDQFKAQDLTYFNQGLRIHDVEVEDGRYTAVWRPGGGAQYWWPGLSYDQFKAQDQTYFNQGLRLVFLQIDGGLYHGVWRSGAGAQYWHAALSWAQFKSQDQTYFNQGLRLADVEVEGSTVYAVWRSGAGAQYWHGAVSVDTFVTLNKQYASLGLTVKILKVKAGAITAVWAPGAGSQQSRFGMALHGFIAEDSALFAAGLRLRALEVHQVPVLTYRLPTDAGDTDWVVGNGNWDDTINGHGQGDPNGGQAYAYDFVHDANNNGIGEEGQNIRAVRAGVVIAMAKNRTFNTWNAQPGDPAYGAPGEGNFAIVRHADNTAAAYCHMKYNQVFVSVGQQIPQGNIIGLSGNTGNSSTAHLHLDVRSYWNSTNDLGPTVPVFFQDNNHTAWRPAVGDLLSSNNS